MAVDALNCRSTAIYVTDGATETYILGNADAYPTTRSSLTFGWDIAGAISAANRDNAIDARLAGINFQSNNGSQSTLRIDLPSAGNYLIHLALGDATSAQAYQYLQLKDDTTPFWTIEKSGGSAAGHFFDARGTDLTSATWPGSELAVAHAFSSPILRVSIGTPAAQTGATTLAHVRVEAQRRANPDIVLYVGE